ncbi:MAG: hypothetical protein A2075_04660 [Geobacteraceae bacterium GWC2_58_44]|nr:MAG: hypothetical protein A2075_04660 [Geobacteraceae bacterium GWC2_58_44]HBG06519.1 hypothetical protein [Geobacter sp.]
MERFEASTAGLLFLLMLGIFVILPGCGKGAAGGGHWDQPVTVSSTTPANDETAVPVGSQVAAAFSREMDPATLTPATFTLKRGTTDVDGEVSYSGVTALFTPATDLPANTLYVATITTGAHDAAGRAVASDYSWSFTTGASPDAIPPRVNSSVPLNLVTGVATNSSVSANFSEPMDPFTINTTTFILMQGSTQVTGKVTYSGVTAVFKPAKNLEGKLLYTATISTGAKDLAGNALPVARVWRFSTAAGPDDTAPTVSSTVPLDHATVVATNSSVSAVFSEPMDPLTITAATFTLKRGVAPVQGRVTYSGVTAIFKPSAVLASNTIYSATISSGANGAKDLKGNQLAVDKLWSFTTGAAPDAKAPVVNSTFPLHQATDVPISSSVRGVFSEAMDPLTINAATFTLKQGTTSISGNLTYSGATAVFKPTGNLEPGLTYRAEISTGARDLAGNALAGGAAANPWTFSTAAGPALAPGAAALASAGSFGIMATAAITNTGASTMINGDVSLDPGSSNGLLPVQVNGAIHINDTVSEQARLDLLVAYHFAKNLPQGTTISGGENLGARFPLGIPPGTYTFGSSMLVSTPLVLDAGGNANAVWVFQIGSSLTTGASVSLANGAQAKNVFWVPTLDATIGVGTIFYGNIVSGRDVTCVTGATINGRILAGATTAGTIALDSNTVNVPAP